MEVDVHDELDRGRRSAKAGARSVPGRAIAGRVPGDLRARAGARPHARRDALGTVGGRRGARVHGQRPRRDRRRHATSGSSARPTTFSQAGPQMSHTYTAPGLYSVQVIATDATGDTASVFFRHLVHYPLTATRPTSSTSIVYDGARNRIYSVNQDNDTVTAIDPDKLDEGRRARRLPEARVAGADAGRQALGRPPGRLRGRRDRSGQARHRARVPPALRVPAGRRGHEPDRRRRLRHADGGREAPQARSRDGQGPGRGRCRPEAARHRGLARRQGRLRHALRLARQRRRDRQGRRGRDEGGDADPARSSTPRRWTAIRRRAAFPTFSSRSP